MVAEALQQQQVQEAACRAGEHPEVKGQKLLPVELNLDKEVRLMRLRQLQGSGRKWLENRVLNRGVRERDCWYRSESKAIHGH